MGGGSPQRTVWPTGHSCRNRVSTEAEPEHPYPLRTCTEHQHTSYEEHHRQSFASTFFQTVGRENDAHLRRLGVLHQLCDCPDLGGGGLKYLPLLRAPENCFCCPQATWVHGQGWGLAGSGRCAEAGADRPTGRPQHVRTRRATHYEHVHTNSRPQQTCRKKGRLRMESGNSSSTTIVGDFNRPLYLIEEIKQS